MKIAGILLAFAAASALAACATLGLDDESTDAQPAPAAFPGMPPPGRNALANEAQRQFAEAWADAGTTPVTSRF